jgi:hypothetical protein
METDGKAKAIISYDARTVEEVCIIIANESMTVFSASPKAVWFCWGACLLNTQLITKGAKDGGVTH